MCAVIERAALFAVALALSACASLPPPVPPPAGVSRAFDQLDLAGQRLDVEWTLPPPSAEGPRAWVLLQHGFARRCANLRGTAAALAAEGVTVLCLNADMAAGAPALAQALAAWWLSPAARSPDGRAAPVRAVLGGHSAGGLFAAQVGAALAERAPERVAGVLLFDPVGGPPLAQSLQRLAAEPGRALHATLAPPVRCNAMQLALPALQAARVQTVMPAGATHVDAEGEDSDTTAVWACREGPPQPAVVAATRRWAAVALTAMLR
jgi:pimeloyl-ACP methyl ester carboxylesterase